MTKQITRQAAAAKAIRADLKRLFPETKFAVRSTSFAGGDAVRITWTDGPTTLHVDALVNQYEAGQFDSTTDMYNYTNRRKDVPTVKYITTHREYSQERQEEARAITAAQEARMVDPSPQWLQDKRTGDLLFQQNMNCTCGTRAVIGDAYCGECGQPLQDDARRRAEAERAEAQEAGIDAVLHTLLNA